MDFKEIASRVLRDEANELINAIENIDTNEWKRIIELIHSAKDSKLIIMGVGKSGLIGAKISATLASTGTSSFFLHPIEAMHGELGMVGKRDIILAISYSGESQEIIQIMPHLKRMVDSIITMTKSKNSSISKMGDYFIDISVSKEACPLNTAPTSSTTLTLALGDALAICMMEKRGFQKEDFAAFHPGGSLGRKLFVKIKDLMQVDNLPIINENENIKNAILQMTNSKLGNVIIARDNKPIAILSDGDLRRALIKENFNMDNKALDYASKNPKICDDENTLAYDVLKIIEDSKIQALIITDKNKTIKGLIHLHKLVESGISN